MTRHAIDVLTIAYVARFAVVAALVDPFHVLPNGMEGLVSVFSISWAELITFAVAASLTVLVTHRSRPAESADTEAAPAPGPALRALPARNAPEDRLGMTDAPTSTTVAALVFALAAAAVGGRTLASLNVAGRPDIPRYGMHDFRDAIYYPAVALLDGRNPYDVPDYTARYPVARKFPLFAPMTLLVYAPLALLSPDAAAVVFLVGSLALTLVLAALLLAAAGIARTPARVLGLAAGVILSHPGQMGLFVGQGVILFAIGLVLAFTPGAHGLGSPAAASRSRA